MTLASEDLVSLGYDHFELARIAIADGTLHDVGYVLTNGVRSSSWGYAPRWVYYTLEAVRYLHSEDVVSVPILEWQEVVHRAFANEDLTNALRAAAMMPHAPDHGVRAAHWQTLRELIREIVGG